MTQQMIKPDKAWK